MKKPGGPRPIPAWTAALVGAVILAVSFALFTAACLSEVREAADKTLSFMKAQVVRYDGSVTDNRTKSLVRLLDKLQALNDLLELVPADAARLERFVSEQRITALVLLDGAGREELSVGDAAVMAEALAQPGVLEIAEYPKKCVLTRLDADGAAYDFVAVARRDAPGVAAACVLKSDVAADGGEELSLDSLFADYTFAMDGAALVTDGSAILSTNAETLFGKTCSEVRELAPEGLKLGRSGLFSLRINGSRWYGKRVRVLGYTLYAVFPAAQVFAQRTVFMGYGLLVYLIVWLCASYLRQRTLRAQMEKIHSQYDTIRAIADLYAASVLLWPGRNAFEIVKAPQRLEQMLRASSTASEMLDVLAESSVSGDFREGFRGFADLATLPERLRSEPYLHFSYRSVTGGWYRAMLLPQSRRADGTPDAVLLMLRDVTDDRERELRYQQELERAAAEARRANAAKTGFLRRMSHDLRTPINGIRGMVEISRHFPDDPARQAACREKIMDASGFLLELVNSLLDMSRLESGEVQLEHRPFDLGALLDAIGTVAENEAASRGVCYRCDRSALRHTALIGSPVHVQQVLQNITVNAVKYNRPGGSVTLSCAELPSDGGEAEFRFVCADTGVGMSEEFQSRAFEPFAQEADAAGSGGIGLGLAIARELTEQMGGSIRFTSRRGVGTTFTVALRFALARESAAPAADGGVSLAGCRVLIAEDNALNLEIAAALLQERGAATLAAENGREAVERFAGSAPGEIDVILMDVLMPEMDGLEAARAIRALPRPDAGTVPILAMTANAFSEDAERSLAAGMNAHLSKPISGAQLAATVAQYWKRSAEP